MNFSDELIRLLFEKLVELNQKISGIAGGNQSNKEKIKEINVLIWSTELKFDEIMQGYSVKLFTPQKQKKTPKSIQEINCEIHQISAVIYLN